MVNINIEIPDELHKQLRLASVIGDKTLKELVIQALETRVATTSGAAGAKKPVAAATPASSSRTQAKSGAKR